MTYTETLEPVRGYTIELVADYNSYDECNPRQFDNVGVMECPNRRHYMLGDRTTEGDQLATAIDAAQHRVRFDVIERYCRIAFGSTVVLPLGLIDHSGISMYVGGGAHPHDPGGWDSGTVGFLFDTERTRTEAGLTPEWLVDRDMREILTSEVTEYDKYLTGDVWGVIIKDAGGNVVDSCYGLLGEDYAREYARELLPEGATLALDQDERDGLYGALSRACQAYGTAHPETYALLRRAANSITAEG
jgi:hypothetical protein